MRHACTSILYTIVFAGASEAATITVPDDYATIQAAINAANDFDEVLVEPGTYSNGDIAIIDPLGKSITIRSSLGPEVTILDGLNERRGIVCYNNAYDNVTIEGFAIRNCIPVDWPGDDGELGESDGAGLNSGSASPTIINCTFESDTQHRNGSPVFQNCTWKSVRHESVHNATPSFTNCNFEDGAGFSGNFDVVANFHDCTFSDGYDSYQGGSIYAGGAAIKLYLDSSAVVDGCRFENNYSATDGGAIMHDSTNGPSGTLLVTNSVFIGNSALNNGGAIYSADSARIEGCTFHANQATGTYGRGGALNIVSGNEIVGCEFVGNTATYQGGTVAFTGYPSIVNSLISSSSIPCISRTSGSSYIDIGSTQFCGHSSSDMTDAWEDLGGNEFDADCEIGTKGSCCINGGCLELVYEDCATVVGNFGGLGTYCAGTSCEDGSNPSGCPSDSDADDDVDVHDLLLLLETWGACP
jgi:predicted outer membrane repeat protein